MSISIGFYRNYLGVLWPPSRHHDAAGLGVNAIFPEFLFHRQWLFGCKVTPIL